MPPFAPEYLSPGYPRFIAGFDLRLDPDATPFRAGDSQYTGTWNKSRNVCLSVDPLVWPAMEECAYDETRNWVSLYDVASEFGAYINRHPEPKLIAAFDLPEEALGQHPYFDSLNQTPRLDLARVKELFLFRGYDIGDNTLTFGGFYSFAWSNEEMADFLVKNEIVLNDVGLAEDEEMAIRAATALTKQIPEHAPFMPCGVWTRKSVGTDFVLK